MSAPFDWSPWLEEGELIVWQAQPKLTSFALMALFAFLALVPMMFFGVHDSSLKARIAAGAAPWIIFVLALLLFFASFVRNNYCLTNRRALALRLAPWGSNFSTVPLADSKAIARHKMPLVFRDRRTGKAVVKMILTEKQEAEVLALLEYETP